MINPEIGETLLWLAHSKLKSINTLQNIFSDSTVLKPEFQLLNKFEHLFSLGEKGKFPNEDASYQTK